MDHSEYCEPLKQRQGFKTTVSKMPRKYSDTKYDNPEYEAKIEKQTLSVIQSITGEDVFKKQYEIP